MAPRWSGEHDWVLCCLYRQGVSLRAIAARLGRSENAVAERRRTLGVVPRPRSLPWSPGEDELLRAATAMGLPAAAVAARLQRPPEQVRRRRRVLLGAGRAPVAFSVVEDAAIAACWQRDGNAEALARELGRPAGSVRLRAQKLGLHRPSARPRWQPHEDAAVRDGYGLGLTCAQIAAELPGRTASAVAARAAKLGLATYARAWTPRDDLELRRLAREGTELERAAQLLARTPAAIRARARKFGVATPHSRTAGRVGRRWTLAEDELLELHRALNPALLAELLDRSPEAVAQRLRRRGLREGAERSPHHPVPTRDRLTPGERAVVTRELRTGGAGRWLAVARRLGRRPADIRALTDPAAGPGTVPWGPLPLVAGQQRWLAE